MGFDYTVMQAIQSLYGVGGELMDKVFIFFTFLGEEAFSLLIIFAIYWCINKKMGEYMIFSIYLAISTNGILKDIVRRPRPFQTPECSGMRYVKVDTLLVNTVGLGTSFSFPSGHSQTAGNIFGSVAFWKKRPLVTVVCVALTLCVMTSRVYLGVHFPTDVIAGAILGFAVAFAAYRLFDRFYRHKLLLMAAAVLLSMGALLLDISSDTFKTVGLGLGALAGIALDTYTLDFKTDGTVIKKIIRLLLGFVAVMALRLGLKQLFPAGMWFDGLRYAIMGFTAMYLWPLIFTKAKM